MMHQPSRTWIRYSIMAIAMGVALAARAGTAPPDAWITTEIKLALLTTEGVSGTAIKVDTVIGRVTLYGKVHSAEEKAKAETIARKVDGVQAVDNLLQVVAPEHEEAMRVSDEHLKQQVEQALEADPSLKSSNIDVRSVNQGVVLLVGTAKTLSAHLRAVEVAAAVPVVRRVASEIQSPDTLADEEIWRARAPHQPSQGYGGVLDTANDIWITSAVRMSLIADSNVPGFEIDLELVGRGGDAVPESCPRRTRRAPLRPTPSRSTGVKRVVNELQVVPSANQRAVNASDDELQREVRKALDEHGFRDVGLEVRNGVARLTGTVPTGARTLEAAVVARSIPGVRAVEDDLRL